MDFGVRTPEISELTDKLFSEIYFAQSTYNQVRDSKPELQESVSELLNQFAASIGQAPTISNFCTGRGFGPFVEFLDGSVKLDLASSSGPMLLGHSHPLSIKAHLKAATRTSVMACNLVLDPDALSLANSILRAARPSLLNFFWYTGSGSYANDNAIKLIWQKHFPKTRLLAFEGTFAGKTIATQNLTNFSSHKEDMPSSIQVDFIPSFEGDEANSIQKTIQTIDELLEKYPDQHCALMCELVQGYAGLKYKSSTFYKAVLGHIKKRGLSIWIDEVQTFGRTNELFAFQHFDLSDFVDIVTVGKALQVSGVLYKKDFKPKSGLLSATFTGPKSAIVFADSLINMLTRGHFFGPDGKSAQLSTALSSILQQLEKEEILSSPLTIGTMGSFIVSDGSLDKTKEFISKLFDLGVVSLLSRDQQAYRVRLLLPLVTEAQHLESFATIARATHAALRN
jgi:4-aminobutyrate aminotransferase-like enzyme